MNGRGRRSRRPVLSPREEVNILAHSPFPCQESQPMSPHLPRARRLAACLLVVTFVALALACGSTSLKPKAVGTVKVNEELVFNDSTWVVLEARDLGKVLKSNDPDELDKM